MLDFIGIGLGPFNLSLASLLQDKTELQYLFFEKKAQFDWHAGMQLPHTVLQVPFMADLVSMVDPTSPFSFLNYLKAHKRLYKFYFLEQAHIPRREYNHYCQWVAAQLQHIHYQSAVTAIYARPQGFEVVVEQAGQYIRYLCRNLVIGSGNVPYLPECLRQIRQHSPEKCLHSADYLNTDLSDLKGNVVVLGSGQSSAEVFMDLFERQYQHDQSLTASFKLHWLTRANGFFPMEYAPLGLEHFSPDYSRHFYQFSETQKAQQLQQQALLYKGISAKTIREIYSKLYHRSIAQAEQQTFLHSQSNLLHAERVDEQIQLVFQHKVTAQQFCLDADLVVASTGYQTPGFDFMRELQPLIQKDTQGQWKITADYRLVHHGLGEIYVQNQEMHSHGVGTPDLGLGAYRAATIINQLAGNPVYELSDQPQCFQHFEARHNPSIRLLTKSESTIFRQASSAFKSYPQTEQSPVKPVTPQRAQQKKLEKT